MNERKRILLNLLRAVAHVDGDEFLGIREMLCAEWSNEEIDEALEEL